MEQQDVCLRDKPGFTGRVRGEEWSMNRPEGPSPGAALLAEFLVPLEQRQHLLS